MIRFGAWVLFCLCVAISLWFFGMPTPLTYVLGLDHTAGQAYAPTGEKVYGGAPFDLTNFLQRIGALLSNTSGIGGLLGLIGGGLVVSALTGFSSMYFVPVVILLFITNFVSMPITSDVLGTNCADANDASTCTQSAGIPVFIYYPLLVIFNFMTIMAAISFIRGGV
jgi:hypothetical protein